MSIAIDHERAANTDADADEERVVVVSAFYCFAQVADPAAFRDAIADVGAGAGVMGGVLVAEEGINGTIAGHSDGVAAVLAFVRAQPGFQALRDRAAMTSTMPFVRLKVEVKPEIVTFRQPGVDPSRGVGRYVGPEEWNALVDDPDVTVIDTRNDFEVQLGTFRGAKNPKTTSFTEFPRYVEQTLHDKNQTVAMFCTGGIRCEKATAYLLAQGFTDVVHLEGGILRYLADVAEDDSRFVGRCFVFDGRVSVGHGLVAGDDVVCYGCYAAVDVDGQQSEHYEAGVSCPRCVGTASPEKMAARRMRHRHRLASTTTS
jgi:UPF0176 protein